jgi:hypothetical protein
MVQFIKENRDDRTFELKKRKKGIVILRKDGNVMMFQKKGK